MSSSIFEGQLKKVEAALEADPGNQALQDIADRLKEAIALSTPTVMKPKEIDILDKPVPNRRHDFKVGDKVEAKSHHEGKWKAARVLAIIGDNITVQFSDRGTAQHCKPNDIRPAVVAKEEQTKLDILHRPIVPDEPSRPRKSRSVGSKRPSRADYIKAREEEQAAKQQSWLQFSKRLKK